MKFNEHSGYYEKYTECMSLKFKNYIDLGWISRKNVVYDIQIVTFHWNIRKHHNLINSESRVEPQLEVQRSGFQLICSED